MSDTVLDAFTQNLNVISQHLPKECIRVPTRPRKNEVQESDEVARVMKERKKESEVAQSCPSLCDPVDCSPPGSSVHGIPQARILEWAAIAFSTSNEVPPQYPYMKRMTLSYFLSA